MVKTILQGGPVQWGWINRDGVGPLRHIERLRKQLRNLNGVSEIDGFYRLSAHDGMSVICLPRAVKLDDNFHGAHCSFSRSSTASALAFTL